VDKIDKRKKTKKSKTTARAEASSPGLSDYQKQSRLAIGALIGFYRRVKRKSQKDLSIKSRVNASAIAMIEAGERLPTADVLPKLARALELDTFQEKQLEFISAHSGATVPQQEQWFMPEDVLLGTPVFLRKLHQEKEFQQKANISEMWIVTSRPLALDGEMYEMLKTRLVNEQTKFIYFIDSTSGESPFRALWSRLKSDTPELRNSIPEKLQCVLTPASFCLQHYGICNPNQLARMFGRLIVYASGIPVGFLSMDSQQVLRAYYLLSPIYALCKSKPNENVSTEFGTFRLLQPDI
jgi:transcriptional regulator with XRE-family HTH domain